MTVNPTFGIDTSIKSIEIGTTGKKLKIPDGWDAFTYRGLRYQRDLDGAFVCIGATSFPNNNEYDDPDARQACDWYPRK